MLFLLSTEGSLVNKTDLLALYLSGTYCQKTPSLCYSSTNNYIWWLPTIGGRSTLKKSYNEINYIWPRNYTWSNSSSEWGSNHFKITCQSHYHFSVHWRPFSSSAKKTSLDNYRKIVDKFLEECFKLKSPFFVLEMTPCSHAYFLNLTPPLLPLSWKNDCFTWNVC